MELRSSKLLSQRDREDITAGWNVDAKKWSEKKMEEDDRLRTLECLRGRLLAERVASRTAKDDAELLSNKLIELENKLKTEIKARDRAEKRLTFLTKKLKSLQIPLVSEESEQSSSSDNSEISSKSSITSSSSKDLEEKEPIHQIPNPLECGIEEKTEKPDSPAASQESGHHQSNPSSADSENHERSSDIQKPSDHAAAAPEEVNIGEVLAALRHVREEIQRSLETSHMMLSF